MDPSLTIDDLGRRHGFVTTASLAEALGVSRQAAHRHLLAAVHAGRLTKVGAARSTRYLPSFPTWRFGVAGSTDDGVWRELETKCPAIATLSAAERAIAVYAITEMVDNAIDHSFGTELLVRLRIEADSIEFAVEDDGIGAFASVRRFRGLSSEIEAAAEITKGKVTTMPDRHSGEGIFFTSRVADQFELGANRVRLVVDTLRGDYAVFEGDRQRGTIVEFRIGRPPKRTLTQVFEAHTEDFEFNKTRTIVKLFGLGRDFVSRSEARRIVEGLDRFREVVVDFEGVPGIGQGFADEIFRVFAAQHPAVRLVPIRMTDAVQFFVERAERARQQET